MQVDDDGRITLTVYGELLPQMTETVPGMSVPTLHQQPELHIWGLAASGDRRTLFAVRPRSLGSMVFGAATGSNAQIYRVQTAIKGEHLQPDDPFEEIRFRVHPLELVSEQTVITHPPSGPRSGLLIAEPTVWRAHASWGDLTYTEFASVVGATLFGGSVERETWLTARPASGLGIGDLWRAVLAPTASFLALATQAPAPVYEVSVRYATVGGPSPMLASPRVQDPQGTQTRSSGSTARRPSKTWSAGSACSTTSTRCWSPAPSSPPSSEWIGPGEPRLPSDHPRRRRPPRPVPPGRARRAAGGQAEDQELLPFPAEAA